MHNRFSIQWKIYEYASNDGSESTECRLEELINFKWETQILYEHDGAWHGNVIRIADHL